MVPFVAAGGLLIALGFAIGGYEINEAPSVMDHFVWTQADSWGALLFQIGGVAFGFLVPVLAGYIAYGMADRPGLVPGFVGGAISLTINAGFLGGLAAGLIAGGVVLAIQQVNIPAALRGIMPVVVIPLISSAVVGFLMFVVIGKPIAEAQKGMTDWLAGLTGANAVLLGALLGLMMCFDLGGPVNKVAYTFATAGIAVADPGDSAMKVMAAVMAAGMVPPLAMALATTVRGRLFNRAERENGKAAWVLGASFISEGAIPFAAADPLRVIPASMAGGAVTGALSMASGATLRAPHGGIFVVPLIGNPLLYLVAIAAGVGVTTALVIVLKGLRGTTDPAARRRARTPPRHRRPGERERARRRSPRSRDDDASVWGCVGSSCLVRYRSRSSRSGVQLPGPWCVLGGMAEHETQSRTTGATVLTLVVVACAAGLADALRRRVRLRRRAHHHAGAEPTPAHTHTHHGTPTVPRQRATGPSVETVRLTEAERDAFAVLVRRLSEGD
ncbi:PTS fructose transporter subunit IIC [Streptomyces albogriseolus]|nr:PTS fructose transporter subunit IIC [Streptomyces albogriseolus]